MMIGRATGVTQIPARRPDSVNGLAGSHSELPMLAACLQPWPKVSVVIPARNEAHNLPHVLNALPEGLHEVILVDGHSTDDTIGVACRSGQM